MADYWLDEPRDRIDDYGRELTMAIASDGIGADIEVVDEAAGAAYRGEMTGYDYDTRTVSLRVEEVRLLAEPEDRWTRIAPAAMRVGSRLSDIVLL